MSTLLNTESSSETSIHSFGDVLQASMTATGSFPKHSDALDAELSWLNLMLSEVEPIPEDL